MKKLPALLVSFVFFAVALVLFSRGLSFPFFYHPDELGKVLQIQNGTRNFNHPLLLLNATAVGDKIAGSPPDQQKVVEIGRWVSVIFAAATVALFALAANLAAGPIAQIGTGWLLLTQPKLFELAHYLKEDPALTMGFALIFVALFLYGQGPTTGRAAWAGVAGGVAISAKYIGIEPAILALVMVAYLGRTRHVLYFLGAVIATMAVINWQIVWTPQSIHSGLGNEIALFHAEKKRSLPDQKMIAFLLDEMSFWTWAGLAAWVASAWIRRRKPTMAEIFAFVIFVVYVLLLIFSTRAATRYALPVIVMLPFLTSVAFAWVGEALAQRFGRPGWQGQMALCGLAAIGLTLHQMPDLRRAYAGFQSDTHFQAAAFIRDKLPAGAVVAADEEALLPGGPGSPHAVPGWVIPQIRILSPHDYLGEDFTVAQLRAKGVTHVALFWDGNLETISKQSSGRRNQEAQKRFLTELTSEAHLVWSCKSRTPSYVDPALRIYELVGAPRD